MQQQRYQSLHLGLGKGFDVSVAIFDQEILKSSITFRDEGTTDRHVSFLVELKDFPLCLPHLFFHVIEVKASITKRLGS